MKIIDTRDNTRENGAGERAQAGLEERRRTWAGLPGFFGRLSENKDRVLADSSDVYFVKASFTVEGSFVIGICLLVICSLILLGYDVFNQALGFVDTVKCRDYDGIRTFRLMAAGRNFADVLKGGG
ncbi:MAG: hypothetical protein VZQ80_06895 [Lachnospiraceae bacterium]|nr:hypothetical protein [Lachnospiraceae bacterium]